MDLYWLWFVVSFAVGWVVGKKTAPMPKQTIPFTVELGPVDYERPE